MVCFSCSLNVGEYDHQVECSRCKKFAHAKCVGLDGAKYSAYQKVSSVTILWCKSCHEFMDSLEGRLAALESKVAAQSLSPISAPAGTSPSFSTELVADLVTKVCEALLPKFSELVTGMVQEALEIDGKKKNLVLVGLPNDIDEKDFVNNACQKLEIGHVDVPECFRDGRNVPGGRSRIVKMKFASLRARRTFLTGFHGTRSAIPGGANCYVRPDLTYRQREQDRLLRAKLKEQREAGGSFRIFRGKIVPN